MSKVKKLDQYRRRVYGSLSKNDQKRILKIQIAIQKRLIEIKSNFYEIGKLLSEAKAILPHGTYERWIKETWGEELKPSTAACFKAIYEKFKDQREKVVLLPISLLQQMAQDTFPDEIISLITENPEAFKEANLTEVRGAYADFKAGKIDLSQFESLAAQQIALGEEILTGQALARHSATGKKIIKVGFYELKSAIWKMRKYTGKIRAFFPPADGERMSWTEMDAREYNCKVDMVNEALDDDLIKEIDMAIEELQKLKVEVEDRRGFWRQRLVQEDGVIRRRLISNHPGLVGDI